ncbi:unnamed protein product [Brassica oleracea]
MPPAVVDYINFWISTDSAPNPPLMQAIVRGSPSGNLQTSLMKLSLMELGDETVVMLRLRIAATQFMDKRKYTNRLTPERTKYILYVLNPVLSKVEPHKKSKKI